MDVPKSKPPIKPFPTWVAMDVPAIYQCTAAQTEVGNAMPLERKI